MRMYKKAIRKLPELISSNDSLENAENVVKAPKNPTNRNGVKIFSRSEFIRLQERPSIRQPNTLTISIPKGSSGLSGRSNRLDK